MQTQTQGGFDRLMLACGRYTALPALLAVIVAGIVWSIVLFANVFHLPSEPRMQWSIGAAVLTWFLVNGLLSGLSVGWVEVKNAGGRLLMGVAQAAAALLLMAAGIVYLWLAV